MFIKWLYLIKIHVSAFLFGAALALAAARAFLALGSVAFLALGSPVFFGARPFLIGRTSST